MSKSIKNIRHIRSYAFTNVNQSHLKPYVEEVAKLYESGKIKNIKTALNLVEKLGSRGLGPKKAVDIIESYRPKPKYTPKPGSLDFGIKNITETKQFKIKKGAIKTQTYFVKAKITFTTTIEKTQLNRKTKQHHSHFWSKTTTEEILRPISASSKSAAKQQFANEITDDIEERDNYKKNRSVDNIDYLFCDAEHDYKATKTENMFMKRTKPVSYNFIPEDATKLKENDECTVNNFVTTYSQKIKKLTRDYFIELCYKVRNEDPNDIHKTSLLDVGLNDSDDEVKVARWSIHDGVTPLMLLNICKILKISHYCFDITKKCCLKHVVQNGGNYKALVYYAVDGHMYHVSNQLAVKSLTSAAKDVETKMNSTCFSNETDETKNIYSLNLPILENIAISELKDQEECIIIYSKQDLSEELDQILEIYNVIPMICNRKYNIVKINFEWKGKKIMLTIDPNDLELMSWKRIKELCSQHKQEFKNQSFSQLISELKQKHFDTVTARHRFSKEERIDLYSKSQICQACEKKVTLATFELDHILALANGGTNELDNIQMLCKTCHQDKTKSEKEDGYVKLIDTESSFNAMTRNIFTSRLCGSYAFIERLVDQTPKIKNITSKVHHLDINKCRKNVMYYSKYSYPVFSVMDKVVKYSNHKGAGLYYIEADSYLPLRGIIIQQLITVCQTILLNQIK
jgi:5-methylcytosine-specific restriction protein A